MDEVESGHFAKDFCPLTRQLFEKSLQHIEEAATEEGRVLDFLHDVYPIVGACAFELWPRAPRRRFRISTKVLSLLSGVKELSRVRRSGRPQ